MRKDEEPVVVEQDFSRPVADVWRAITDIDEMRKWFFENIPDFKAVVGFRTQFPVDSGNQIFEHLWTVTEVIPKKKLVYNWNYEGLAGDSNAIFELSGNDQTSQLRLTLEVLQDFSDDIAEFRRESCIGGWNYFIRERLKIYLE